MPQDPSDIPVQLRPELLATGYDDAAIAAAVRRGELARVRRGAYVDASTFAQLDQKGVHALRARAAARQAKTGVVISHASAITLYPGVPTWGLDLTDVHLTRIDGKTGRAEAGVRQHRGHLLAEDSAVRGDVQVTTPARALLEVTTDTDVEAGLVVTNHFLHHGLVTMDDLVERYRGSIDRWPRTLNTDMVLRLADPRIESVGESRTHHLCFRQGLPMPIPQFEVYDEYGRLVARLDFAWPDLKAWVEFDGRVKYQELLQPGESPTDVVLREKRRQEMVERLTGWICIRLTWSDLNDPARVAAIIRRAFAMRASA